MIKAEKAERKAEALATLRHMIKKGDTIYTVMRHVNHMGTYRVAAHYVIKHNRPIWIAKYVCRALGNRWDDRHEGTAYPNHQPPADVASHLSYALHGHKDTRCKCADQATYKRCWHKAGDTLRHEWL